MLRALSQKFRSGCMMLARENQGAVALLGSAFIVHREVPPETNVSYAVAIE